MSDMNSSRSAVDLRASSAIGQTSASAAGGAGTIAGGANLTASTSGQGDGLGQGQSFEMQEPRRTEIGRSGLSEQSRPI